MIPLALLLLAGVWVNRSDAGDGMSRIEGFSMVLQRHENKRKKVEISAQSGSLDGQAIGVIVRFYTEEEELEASIDVGECQFDRAAGRVESQSRVRMQKGDMVITGKGFEWNAKDQSVRILRDVKVQFRTAPRGFHLLGGMPPSRGKVESNAAAPDIPAVEGR